MKTFIIILLTLLIAGGAITIFLIVRSKKIKAAVISSSVKLKRLFELNRATSFHDIQPSFKVYKHYDNKSNFNRIDPAYIMTAELKNNINFFSKYSEQIFENRRIYKEYQNQVLNISTDNSQINYSELKIKEKVYKKYEDKLFSEKKLKPVVDCEFTVNMTYTSPKGRVNLLKKGVYFFNDLYACLESISRSHLDRNTYQNLAAVERGEVSDSLRYDILNRDGFKCVICGASASQGARLHVDHIIPIAKGGKSIPSNLRTLCERCNIGKSDKIESVSAERISKKDNNTCDLCGAKLILREGKYGKFYGCSRYPNCKFTKKID